MVVRKSGPTNRTPWMLRGRGFICLVHPLDGLLNIGFGNPAPVGGGLMGVRHVSTVAQVAVHDVGLAGIDVVLALAAILPHRGHERLVPGPVQFVVDGRQVCHHFWRRGCAYGLLHSMARSQSASTHCACPPGPAARRISWSGTWPPSSYAGSSCSGCLRPDRPSRCPA